MRATATTMIMHGARSVGQPTMSEQDSVRFDDFGEDPESWNIDSDGLPGIEIMTAAIATWSWCNEAVSVLDAARAFRIQPWMAAAACDGRNWMFFQRRSGELIFDEDEPHSVEWWRSVDPATLAPGGWADIIIMHEGE